MHYSPGVRFRAKPDRMTQAIHLPSQRVWFGTPLLGRVRMPAVLRSDPTAVPAWSHAGARLRFGMPISGLDLGAEVHKIGQRLSETPLVASRRWQRQAQLFVEREPV